MTEQLKAEAWVRSQRPVFNGKYLVDDLGRVWSNKNQQYLAGHENANGYIQVDLYNENGKRNKLSVHRIVAEAFIPNPKNKPWINHKDSNRSNNNLDNLEWATPTDNQYHAWSEGKRSNTKSSSGERFIYLTGDAFRIRVPVAGEMVYIGMYLKLVDAVVARNKFLKDLKNINYGKKL